MHSSSLMVVIALLLSPLNAIAIEPAEQLRTLFVEEWQYNLRESPVTATYLGDNRYNDRWADVSLLAIAKRDEHQRGVLERLKTIDTGSLTAAERNPSLK